MCTCPHTHPRFGAWPQPGTTGVIGPSLADLGCDTLDPTPPPPPPKRVYETGPAVGQAIASQGVCSAWTGNLTEAEAKCDAAGMHRSAPCEWLYSADGNVTTWHYCSELSGMYLGYGELRGGNDNSAKNQKACDGECDTDSQCAAGLKCFQRSNGEAIPGCSGDGTAKDWDYCHDPAATGSDTSARSRVVAPGCVRACGRVRNVSSGPMPLLANQTIEEEAVALCAYPVHTTTTTTTPPLSFLPPSPRARARSLSLFLALSQPWLSVHFPLFLEGRWSDCVVGSLLRVAVSCSFLVPPAATRPSTMGAVRVISSGRQTPPTSLAVQTAARRRQLAGTLRGTTGRSPPPPPPRRPPPPQPSPLQATAKMLGAAPAETRSATIWKRRANPSAPCRAARTRARATAPVFPWSTRRAPTFASCPPAATRTQTTHRAPRGSCTSSMELQPPPLQPPRPRPHASSTRPAGGAPTPVRRQASRHTSYTAESRCNVPHGFSRKGTWPTRPGAREPGAITRSGTTRPVACSTTVTVWVA